MFGTRDTFEYFECRLCGCLQIGDFPQDASRYYPAGYYAHSVSPEAKYAGGLRSYALNQRNRYAVFHHGLIGRFLCDRIPEPGLLALQELSLSSEASILDVGCGNGLRLYALRQIGFQHLLGIDPFIQEDKTYRNGLSIEKRTIENVAGSWDVIMFHHVFEHIDDPLGALIRVKHLLKPSGSCVLRIPTVSSFAWRHYRTDWVQLDAPRHLFLHSRGSIERLAKAAGLRLSLVRYDSGAFQFWGSEQYRRDIPLRDPRSFAETGRFDLFTKAEISEFDQRAIRLNAENDGDAAAFYLRPM